MTGEGIHEDNRLKKTNVQDRGTTLTDALSSSHLNSAFLSANLTQLKLSGSGLSQLPVDLPPSDTIVEVDLSRNRLSQIPATLCSLKNLRLLNLSGNDLTKVPEALYQGLHMLKILNLSGNKLVTFQRPPICLPLLQNLDLSSNKLVAPPPWLLDDLPTSLDWLDLSDNPCFLLSPRHSQLLDSTLLLPKVSEKIKTIRLVSCGLRGAVNEKYIINFKNVLKLDIGNMAKPASNNSENFIPDLTIVPESVQELSLASAGLACLPKTVTALPNLRKLDISNNVIHWFPPAVGNLKTLTVIRAEYSRIYLLPPEMNLLSNLKELYLSNNEMSSTDGFENLASLEVLDLYENQFITVPDLKNLTRLRALDFCQNFIDPPELFVLDRVVPYMNLRACFRSNYCQRNQNRCSGAKEFPVLPEIDEDRYSNFSDTHDVCPEFEHDTVDGEEDVTQENKSSGRASTNGEVEVWDIDSDDNYDPNEFYRADVIPVNTEEEEDLTGQTSHEVRNHPHYFIPFRTASPGSPPEQLDTPLEGQFDD